MCFVANLDIPAPDKENFSPGGCPRLSWGGPLFFFRRLLGMRRGAGRGGGRAAAALLGAAALPGLAAGAPWALGLGAVARWLPGWHAPGGGGAAPDGAADAGALEVLRRALRLRTVAGPEGGGSGEWGRLHALLRGAYPAAFARARAELLLEHTLMLTWTGSDPSLPAHILVSHSDVVPAPGAEAWTLPPFAGEVRDSYVWGRGALDTKTSLVQIMSALEQLARRPGFKPRRTLVVCFGHDEETGGAGARAVARTLKERGLEVDTVFDEGGFVLLDGMEGLFGAAPGALVGIAEKRVLNINVTAVHGGGHSSLPMRDGQSVPSTLAAIALEVERRPPPARLTLATEAFLMSAARTARWYLRPVLALAGLPGVRSVAACLMQLSGHEGDAMVRSTVAVTKIGEAGEALNSMPRSGWMVLNFRAQPGDDDETLLEYTRKAVRRAGAEGRTTLEIVREGGGEAHEPPGVADPRGPAFAAVELAIRQTLGDRFPGLVVAPYLLSGATDSRHFGGLAKGGAVRFTPMSLRKRDIGRIHSVDERISLQDFFDGIAFYRRLVELISDGMEELEYTKLGGEF